LGTQLAHSSSYHPQSDGQTEIVNKCLEGYLRCFVPDKKTQWFKWLPLAKWWYNTSFHTATKMTPFMALYGYHPPSITSSLKEKSKVQAVEDHIENQQQILQILKDNLRSISEYLIKWRKLPAEDSTWEDESFIQKHPELLKRCGQHLSQGEGHVKP
jgi:hypothetical protein